jgi:hypothetical protein
VLAGCLLASTAFAQGGGASSTGSINGKVADTSNAVLPGVTVTVASPSMMGVQTSVTDGGGNYRFPALPPGSYTVTFELPGFNTLKRENIQIALGFTATVNVELAVASLQETVTVTGDSPVIDTSNTRVQENFKLEALNEIPNARDMWSLLAITPSVQMARIDVGGNRAGTQTTYTAYGYSGQNRVLVEGINTTEGTSGAGFYTDYGSFEEIYLGTAAQGAEMPTPGVQSNLLGKSGGNQFHGEIYKDFENNSMQGDNVAANLPSQFAYDPVTNPNGVHDHSNELQKYNDFNIDGGGPIKKDKVWWYGSYRYQSTDVGQPNFVGPIAGTPFHTNLWNPSGKVTLQMNQNNKLIGYYQWGQKVQPNRLPTGTSGFAFTSLDGTLAQTSGSWLYKGEWNSTLGKNMYLEAKYGVFGYYFPLQGNEADPTRPEIWDTPRATFVSGGDQQEQTDRQRRQVTGALTYFKDGWGGTHNLKFGGEYYVETGWYGTTQLYSGNVREYFNNGAPSQIRISAPTATSVGKLGAGPNGDLTSVVKLTTIDAFGTDQFTIGRATLNLGLRYDHYRSWSPQQSVLPFSFGPLSVPADTIAETTYATFSNGIAPRLGVAYDLGGDGKTVLKVNYGLYWFNPGPNLASNANPNQASKFNTYNWKSANPNCNYCTYNPATDTVSLTASALKGAVQIDPNLRNSYSNQASAFVERQVTEGVGVRVGYTWLATYNQSGTFQTYRPASAYTVPFNVTDPVTGTVLTEFGVPNSTIPGCTPAVTTPTASCQYPVTSVVANMPDNGSYKTIEASGTKRLSHHFSAGGGYAYTWINDYPQGFPNTPNAPGRYPYSFYSFKGNAQFEVKYGILLSLVYRFQAGQNYARLLTITQPSSCACTWSGANNGPAPGSNNFPAPSLSTNTVFATPFNAYRQDNLSVFDLRVEKTLPLFAQTKIRLFLDGYNLFNKYAAEQISYTTGSGFQSPTSILGPRTARVGFRFLW